MSNVKTLSMSSALTGLAAAAVLSAPVVWAQADQGQVAQNGPTTDQGQAAAGQQAQNGQNGAAAPAAEEELQEVVVTAERRTEDIQTTPISVEAMSQAQLSQDNVTHIKELQYYTPSLSVLDAGLYQAFLLHTSRASFAENLMVW